MSSLLCMNIRGVRSFASDTEQRIEFFKPLTVIVGPNGCGKTSTIECLRYATTGSLPPGSQSGRAFVHDPKVEGEAEVKASVKLLFETADKSKRYMAIRNMQLTQKKKTSQFKQIDGVLRAIDNNATNPKHAKTEITQKCAQLNDIIPSLLGISRAVLDNVIFCHQEDSCWPLKEGSELKKRFDDIFESTRYTKALEEIIKQKKVQVLAGKDTLSALAMSKEHHQQFLSLEQTKDDLEERFATFSSNDKQQKTVLANNEKEYRACQMYMREVSQKNKLLLDLRNEKKLKEKELARHITNMSEELEDSTEELIICRDQFEEAEQTRKKELRKLETDVLSKQKKLKSIDSRLKGLNVSRGEYQGAVQSSNQHVKEHTALRDQMIDQYNLPPLSGVDLDSQSSSSQQDPSNGAAVRASRTVLAELQKEKRRRKRNLNDQEKEGKVEYSKLQQNLSNVSGNVQVTKAQIKQKNKEKTSLEGQRRNVNDDIRTNFPRSIDEEKKKTRQHDDEVESCEKKINDFEKEQNLDARRQEKSTLRTDDNVLQKKEKKLRERQGQLLKHQSTVQMLADQNSKLEEVKTTLTEDVEELATAFEEAFDTEIPREEHDASQQNVVARYREKQLITFADKVIEDIDFKEHEIQKKHKNAEKATSKNLTKLNKQDALLTQKQSQLKTVTSKVNALEEGIVAGLTELKEKLDNNDELDYTQSGMEDMLSVLEEKLDKAKEAPMTAKVLLDNWGKIISRFNKKKICTCCNRSADEEEEDAVLEFMVQKKDALEVRVAKYQNTNQDLTDATEQLRQFKQLKDQQWQPWKIQKQSISKLEHEIKQYETSKQTAHDNWDVEHQKTITLGEKLGHINALSKKTHALTNHIKNMKGIMIQVEKCEEQMPKTTSSSSSSSVSSMAINADMNEYTSLEGIEVGLEKVEKERNEIGDRLVELDRALDEGMRKIKNLQDSLSNARKQKQSHSERIQKLMALKASVTDMEKRIKSLTEQVTDHEKELKKCQREEISCKADLEAKETELDGALEEVKLLYSACHESCLEYDNSHKQLEKDAAKGSIAKLNKCDSDIAKSEEEKKEIDKYIVKQQPNIRAMRDRQNQAGAMKKTVVDNITSRELQSELDQLETTIAAKEDDYKQLNPTDQHAKMLELESDIQELRQNMAKASGSKEELKRQLKETLRELKDKKFKDIENRVRKLTIHHKTVEMAIKDLERYHGALDGALQSYHAIKVKEINMIIKEIWQICYKGGDVDMIEVRSDPTKATKTRARSYNYRIVMTKGNTELDMRGRCSAGQKQLASLVIRMALAETFCVNCGILALDEPTTNLDDENKRGLCEALSTIIEARSKQENFQLIVITHDEQFVRMLGRGQGDHPPEYFYSLSRREAVVGSGHFISEIKKKSFYTDDDDDH